MTSSVAPLSGNLSIVSATFAGLPVKKEVKKRPLKVEIFEYDNQPLGDRHPFLFVHGLRGEYWPTFRWSKVIQKFTSNPDFGRHYKIYLMRYDTLKRFDQTVPEFKQAIASLFAKSNDRPITILALSLGGNMVYDGMLDSETNKRIRLAFTLGTPFHGSPLFCKDWLQYSVYKNPALPWTRVDHGWDYKFYFQRNPSLLEDLRWDNADASIPEVGRFHSRIPLGPSGNLTIARTANERLAEINRQPFDKKKLITYGGYLLNTYMLPENKHFIDVAVNWPITLLAMKVPAHLAREHPVLKMLNQEISSIVPSQAAEKKAGSQYLYQLNDGITPIESAIFLPTDACASIKLVNENELPKIKNFTDVGTARVFRNIDHLTFIDGSRPKRSSAQMRDELNPDAGSKTIFDWMLADIMRFDQDQNQIARETQTPGADPAVPE